MVARLWLQMRWDVPRAADRNGKDNPSEWPMPFVGELAFKALGFESAELAVGQRYAILISSSKSG
jgi:hypothetical protein